MEKQDFLEVISQENLFHKLESFCSERRTRPLIIFYNSYVNDHYDPEKTLEEVSEKNFGIGQMKVVNSCGKSFSAINEQVAYLKALPQKLIQIRSYSYEGIYDHVMLLAELLAKQTGKYIVAMITDKNRLSDNGFFTRKFYYHDVATETFLAWRGRVDAWVADYPTGYSQTRQVYLAFLKAGVLDMMKTWMEEGQTQNILKAINNNGWLNDAYRQYVCSRVDVPDVLKHATFAEQLLVSEEETENGRVTTIKVESMENTGCIECRCVNSAKGVRELKLILN